MSRDCRVVKDLPTWDKFQVTTPPSVTLIRPAYDEAQNKRSLTVDTKGMQFRAFIIERLSSRLRSTEVQALRRRIY